MTETIMTGMFTLFGVVLGGLTSWIVAIYTSKKEREERLVDKQKALCLAMLQGLNEMLDNLPQEKEDLPAFKEYLLSEFYPKRTNDVIAEEMLYLSDDIRTTYLVICVMAENDFRNGRDFDVVRQTLIMYRNVFVKMLREDFNICESENTKSKNKRFDRLIKEEIEELNEEFSE